MELGQLPNGRSKAVAAFSLHKTVKFYSDDSEGHDEVGWEVAAATQTEDGKVFVGLSGNIVDDEKLPQRARSNSFMSCHSWRLGH